jgi:hypothetical protein
VNAKRVRRREHKFEFDLVATARPNIYQDADWNEALFAAVRGAQEAPDETNKLSADCD